MNRQKLCWKAPNGTTGHGEYLDYDTAEAWLTRMSDNGDGYTYWVEPESGEMKEKMAVLRMVPNEDGPGIDVSVWKEGHSKTRVYRHVSTETLQRLARLMHGGKATMNINAERGTMALTVVLGANLPF